MTRGTPRTSPWCAVELDRVDSPASRSNYHLRHSNSRHEACQTQDDCQRHLWHRVFLEPAKELPSHLISGREQKQIEEHNFDEGWTFTSSWPINAPASSVPTTFPTSNVPILYTPPAGIRVRASERSRAQDSLSTALQHSRPRAPLFLAYGPAHWRSKMTRELAQKELA